MRRIYLKIKFWFYCNRIGPDIPLTHILLFSKRLGRWLARRKLLSFGEGAEIRPYAYLVETQSITIGKNVVVRPGCMFFGEASDGAVIIIEDNVLIGSCVHIYASNHNYDDPTRDIYEQGHSPVSPVLIKQGAWIGANVTILPGVVIGRNAVVGAGSVVTKDVGDFQVVAGIPAHKIKS